MRKALPPKLARLRNPVALIGIAVAGFVRGSWYLASNDLTMGTMRAATLIDRFLPFWAYAALWIVASVAFAVSIPTRGKLLVWAGSVTVGLWGLWAITFIVSYFVTNSPSGILTGVGFGAFALTILAVIQEEVEHENAPSRGVVQ